MTSHKGQTKKSKGHPRSVLEIWCNSDYYFRSYDILKKYFSLIGCHLESVGRTEPVFELNRFKNSDLRSKTKRIRTYVKQVKNVYPVTGNFALEAIMI